MFQLIQSITSELNKINDLLVKENNLQEECIQDTGYTQETTSFSQEEPECDDNEIKTEPIVNDSVSTDTGPNIAIHAVRIAPVEMMVGSMNENQQEDEIKVVDLSTNDDNESQSESESELESDSDENEDIELEVIKQPESDENKIEIKVEPPKEKSKTLSIVDYSKMHVGALREILVEKGLVTDAKKLKKKEMLELLG